MGLAPGLHPRLSGMRGDRAVHLGSQGQSPKRVRGQVIPTEAILVVKPLPAPSSNVPSWPTAMGRPLLFLSGHLFLHFTCHTPS